MAVSEDTTADGTSGGCNVFISYKRGSEPDESLATFLCESLASQGHSVFIDLKTPIGGEWPDTIEDEIAKCDFFVVLLTKASVAWGYVVAETLIARDSEVRLGRPKILPVRVAYTRALPLHLSGAIGHLQYAEWDEASGHDALLSLLLQRIAKRDGGEARATALMRGDHFIITGSMWQSTGAIESLAGTTIVPVRPDEESSLAVTRAKGPGFFTVRVQGTGALEVAVWKGSEYRAVKSQPGQFIEMLQGDYNKWCFAYHQPDEAILLQRPDGRKDPIVITFDQDVVRGAWSIAHQRGGHLESFLIVMKDTSAQ
jgi:hypothetical protein